jgi:hypothetical protein
VSYTVNVVHAAVVVPAGHTLPAVPSERHVWRHTVPVWNGRLCISPWESEHWFGCVAPTLPAGCNGTLVIEYSQARYTHSSYARDERPRLLAGNREALLTAGR